MTGARQGDGQRNRRARAFRAGPLLPAVLVAAVLVAAQFLAAPAQPAERCAAEAAEYLEELPLAEGEIKSVRLMEKVNIADDFGPEIFGVDAWVRLNSCSGWLVLNLSKGCFLLQAYTRGDCEVEGLDRY